MCDCHEQKAKGLAGKSKVLLLLCLTVVAAFSGQAVSYTEGFVTLQTSGSFFTNAVNSAEGWTPAPVPYSAELWGESNYVINANLQLTTPGTGDPTEVFGGNQLILDNNNAQVTIAPYYSKPVFFKDLTIRRGKLNNGTASSPSCVSGVITIDAAGNYDVDSSTVEFGQSTATVGGGEDVNPMSIKAKLIATSGNVVKLRAEDGWTRDGDHMRWWSRTRSYRFEGDCSSFFATVGPAKWRANVVLACGDFGGSISIENLGRLSVWKEAVGEMVVHGTVTMSDGWLEVPDGKSMSATSLSSAYAAASSYMKDGICAYDGKAYTELDPYLPRHEVEYRNGNLGVNTITIGDGAVLTIGDAALDKTLLDLSGGGMIVVTNSLTVNGPIQVRPSSSVRRQSLVSLPVGRGVLSVSDFCLADGCPSWQYELSVSEEGGVQYLTCLNVGVGPFDASNGYVCMTNTEDSASQIRKINGKNSLSFSDYGWWDEDCPPHSNTNYFSNSKVIRLLSGVFQGDSLTVNNAMRIDTVTAGGGECTIDDARFVPLTKNKLYFALSNTSNPGRRTLGGEKWRVFSTADNPLQFRGNARADLDGGLIDLRANLYGSEDAVIKAWCDNPKQSGCEPLKLSLNGDCSNYKGRFVVGTEVRLSLGNCSFGGTVESGDGFCHPIETCATNGAVIPVDNMTLCDGAQINVAATNVLCVGTLNVTGTAAKCGDGLLIVKGSEIGLGSATINVQEGGLQVDRADALNGVDIAFADGTEYVRDVHADLGDTGLCDVGSITASGLLRVKLAGGLADGHGMVPLMTLPSADASAISSHMSFLKVPGYSIKAVLSEEVDGKRTICATYLRPGFVLTIK